MRKHRNSSPTSRSLGCSAALHPPTTRNAAMMSAAILIFVINGIAGTTWFPKDRKGVQTDSTPFVCQGMALRKVRRVETPNQY